jgi:hypothetical protein
MINLFSNNTTGWTADNTKEYDMLLHTLYNIRQRLGSGAQSDRLPVCVQSRRLLPEQHNLHHCHHHLLILHHRHDLGVPHGPLGTVQGCSFVPFNRFCVQRTILCTKQRVSNVCLKANIVRVYSVGCDTVT